ERATGALDKICNVARMPLAEVLPFLGRVQLLVGEGAYRIEHREAMDATGILGAHQPPLHQPCKPEFYDGLALARAADTRRRLHGPPPGKHRQAPEERLLVGSEQGIAPGDRRAQRLLAEW